MKKITLGFSPCPNDTFIFDALVNGKIDSRGLQLDYVLEDVETLNRWALEGKLDVTKLSFAAFLQVSGAYALLRSGAALGRGVGPLLIASRPLPLERIQEYTIAVPGKYTTASMLLSLAFPAVKRVQEFVFHEIEQAVLSGACDAGVIIHENRFTYEEKGLVKLLDLGDWWEKTTGAAIPLGGIVAKKNLPQETVALLESLIRESIAYAWNHYPVLSEWIREHAQEMKEEVMRQHIELYVNDYTHELGQEGERAIQVLFRQAAGAGKITQVPDTVFR